MPEQSPPKEEPKPPEGLSQFLGKVLDQLSLSAWLPAMMLVGCLAVLTQLRTQGNFDFGHAVVALTAKPLGILVVLFFALVLATMVSQAFAFTAIRWLEGYWRGPLVKIGIYRLLVRHKARQCLKLEKRSEDLEKLIDEEALQSMRGHGIPREVIWIMEAENSPEGLGVGPWTEEHRKTADDLTLRHFARPDRLGRSLQLIKALDEYPRIHRMMPTKLGNVLRATEDVVTPEGEETEGIVLRRGETIPPRLRQHHDQFRTRLDMYCTLVFIHVILAALALVVLGTRTGMFVGAVLVAVVFLIFAIASYSAAIASARGYCATLRAIFAEPD
ncbi:hypothetical protein [Labedaea rhizosphaerae]|uniref:Uncharacterized protein n=1 Tax=Labedaea rhizosphaerae TaxID=598644 RepID=A0A4V6PVT1_LABRH|nr:hypothetical protein [Labedaea rhizosphaerae]TDP96638.1 hypothetical protein EV186_104626 [Labedaea rhizosphaerae]